MGTLFEVDGTTGVVSFKQKGTSQFVLEKGTSFPGSPSDGQQFYRTDLTQLYIYDNASTTWRTQAGGSLRIWNETPSGTVNGSNTVFTTATAYVTGTTQVTRDGLMLKPGGVDYTETSPSAGTITFVTAPTTGSTILVSYSRTIGQDVPKLILQSYVVGTASGTYTGSTTLFNLPFTYTAGVGSLLVFASGVLMTVTNDYTETSSTSITFVSARTVGEAIKFIKLGVANDYGNTGGWVDDGTVVRLETITDKVGIQTTSPNSSLEVSGSVGAKVTSVSTTYTAANDYTILASASGGSFTITLPASSGVTNRMYVIKKTDSSVNTVTIDANASETIDGALTYVLTTQYAAITIACNGSNWFII